MSGGEEDGGGPAEREPGGGERELAQAHPLPLRHGGEAELLRPAGLRLELTGAQVQPQAGHTAPLLSCYSWLWLFNKVYSMCQVFATVNVDDDAFLSLLGKQFYYKAQPGRVSRMRNIFVFSSSHDFLVLEGGGELPMCGSWGFRFSRVLNKNENSFQPFRFISCQDSIF